MADLPDWMSGASTGTETSPAPPPKSNLPDWMQDNTVDKLDASMKAGSQIAPDTAAKVLKLRDQTGLATPLIARNVDQVAKQQTANAVTPADFQKDHPIVADWLSEDPHHAAVAGSDIPVLGFLERQFHYLYNQGERGAFDAERSYLGLKAFLGIGQPGDEQRRQLIEQRLQGDLNIEPPGRFTRILGNVVESAPQLAGVMGAAGIAGVAAGPAAATAATAGAFAAMETGNAYLDFRNRKDAQGNPISESEARGWATVSGVLNGAAAIVPVGKMMEQIPGFRMLGRDGINSILENPSTRAAFQNYVKGIGESGLTMGGFSGFQSLVHNAAGQLAEMHSDGSLHAMSPMAILTRVFSPENMKAAVESAGSGAVTGAAFGGALGAYGLYRGTARVQDAQRTAESWKGIGEVIQAMEMQKRAPDQVEKVIDRLTTDKHVFIPLEQWQTYWEGKKADPRAAFNEVVGNTTAYDEALRTGVDLQIPASRYASTLAPSEHNEFFSQHLRSEPQALNADEAQKSTEIRSEMEKQDQKARENISEAISPTQLPVGETQKPGEAKGKPYALFIGNQEFGEEKIPYGTIYGEHEKFRGTFPLSEIQKMGIPVTGREARVPEGVIPASQAVKQSQDIQGMAPLFADPASVGMKPEKAARYANAIEQARADAQEDIVRKITDKALKEKSASWLSERAKVEEQVKQDAITRPEYRALNFLQGKLPIGDVEPFKLSHADVIEHDPLYSVVNKSDANQRGYPSGITTEKGGVDVDAAAEILGFNSGSEMLHHLKSMVPFDDFVKQQTDARMVERHPSPGSMFGTASNLADEAMKAVHNNERSKVLRLELEHLASEDFATFKGLTRAIMRRIPTIEEVRGEAETMIGAKTTAETLPSLYERAESISSREAQEHFFRGDFEKAFEAKKQELLNHELYRAAQNAREQSAKDVNYAGKFERDSVRARIGKAGGEYLEQIDALRERFDFGRATLKELKDRQGLRDFVESQRKAGYEPAIPPELLNEAYKKSWREMTNDELHSAVDTMRNIDHLSALKTKLLAAASGRDYEQVKQDVLGALQENFDLNPEKLGEAIDLHPDFKDRIKGDIASFAAWRTKMEFLFRFMDGGKYHGPAWETFFKPMNDAEDFKTSRMSKAADAMDEIFKEYPRSERAKFYSRLTYVPELEGSRIKPNMNKMEMMMTVLHWGNEGNRTELLRGYGWNESQVRAIWKHLDARDLQTAQKIWNMVDSYWPEIAAQERELNGLTPEKIQASPFDVTLKDGSSVHLAGGYFPLVYDKRMSWRTAALGEDAMVKDMFASGAARAATKRGWTNERIGGGGQAPSLNMSAFVNHVSDVIHDLAYRKPVIDLYKLINDQEIRGHIEAAAGKELYKQLNPWLKRIAGDRPWNPLGPLEGLNTVRTNMTAAELGLKFTSAAIHSSSYIVAARELGARYALLGLKDSADIRGAWNFVKEKSEFMRSRPENFDRDIRAAGRDLNIAGVSDSKLNELKAYSPIKRSSFWAIMRGFDLGVAVPTWMGAYRKAMEGGVKNIEPGNEPDAIDYADQLVRDTKGSGAAKDLAPIQSAGGELGKLFTMFYTQLNVIDNQFMMARREQRAGFKTLPQTLATAAMVWFLPAAATELLRGKTPRDDEGWGSWLLKSELMYPMQMMPGLREATSYWQRGDLQASPVFEAIKTMLKTAKSTAQITPGLKDLAGEKDEWTAQDYEDALMSIGYGAGVPTRQALRTTQYLHDWMTGSEQPDSPVEGIWRSLVGRKAR